MSRKPRNSNNGKAPPDPLLALGHVEEAPDTAVYLELARCLEAGEAAALVTVIGEGGSSPRNMGAVMLVRPDGSIVGTIGGGSLEHLIIQHAQEAINDGRPRRYLYDYTGGRGQNLVKACMGKTEFLVQPFAVQPQLCIFGAGHVAQALAPMAQSCGFRVTVLDDRDGWPREQDFPRNGVRLLHGPFEERMAELSFDAQATWLVIVTYGHTQDEAVLRACLPRPWRYCGLIGSQAKVATVFRDVAQDLDDEAGRARLEQVHAPIGLTLGGRGPGEIAASILAELLAEKHGRGDEEIQRHTVGRRVRLHKGGAKAAAADEAGNDHCAGSQAHETTRTAQ